MRQRIAYSRRDEGGLQEWLEVEVHPGLSADREQIPAGGPTFATLHYAQTEAGTASWSINGAPYSEALVQDAGSGLWYSEIEVDAVGRSAGDLVVVTCNGASLTLEVV